MRGEEAVGLRSARIHDRDAAGAVRAQHLECAVVRLAPAILREAAVERGKFSRCRLDSTDESTI